MGLDWLRDNLRYVPLLCVCKTARLCLWLPDFDGGSQLYYVVRVLGYAPFLLLMMLGIGSYVRRRAFWGPEQGNRTIIVNLRQVA